MLLKRVLINLELESPLNMHVYQQLVTLGIQLCRNAAQQLPTSQIPHL
jgi:hypothetical protein